MIVTAEDCDRDLMRKEAAASMALPAGAGKKKKKEEAGASERRVPLATLFPVESTAEARPTGARARAGAGKKRKASTAELRLAGAGKKMEAATAGKMMEAATAEKKMKEAVASESGGGALKEEEECDSLFKEGEMLRLREEYWEAQLLWGEKLVPGALDRWLEMKAMQVPAIDQKKKKKKKKKKVVRLILPDGLVDCMIQDPNFMTELSDEEMAKCSKGYRQTYGIAKVINAKNRAYRQALIDQYQAFGFAYDEKEVTDDEEEDVGKN